jgi:hypothetical protein
MVKVLSFFKNRLTYGKISFQFLLYLAALNGNEGQALSFNTEKQLVHGGFVGLQVSEVLIENKLFYYFLKVNPKIFAIIT